MKHGEVEVTTFTFNPFSTNSFVVSANGQAIIVDASAYNSADVAAIESFVQSRELEVVRLILTHAHIDHIFGCARLARAFGLGWEMGSKDQALLKMGQQQASIFGVELEDPGELAGFLEEGDTVELGGQALKVADVPGHSPGSIALIDRENGYVLSGDVLFQNSIGRTDLWQGDYATLLRSIQQVLMTQEDEMVVYSGHGPATTIGEERASNPFLVG